MNLPSLRVLTVSIAATLCAVAAHADVRLPAVISDHMVLQQEMPASVWGWAEPGEKVTVKFAAQTLETTADPEGRWRVKFAELAPGSAGEMTVAGKNTLTIHDVVAGEVWIASGQSNMEFTVGRGKDAQQEIAAANYPKLRMFTVQKNAQLEPQEDLPGKWAVATPETAGAFSAVGYFFARKLNQTLKQPIGILHTSWGGTPAEYWTPRRVLAADAVFKPIFDSWEAKVAAYPKAKETYDADLARWKEAEKTAREAGKPVPPPPRAPIGDGAVGSPGCLYNGMIAPLTPYTLRGAIWYQGEANAGNAKLYRRLFPTMILSWRQAWKAEFPFLFVQLANFNAKHQPPTGQPEQSAWAELREAQMMTLELPRTGMAVAIDIGEADDIHPKNKQEVGRRLAMIAEASAYYRDQEFSGPLFGGAQIEDGKIRLSFRNSDGMKAADGGKLKGFAIAGEDKKFVWADAAIEGDHVLVSSPEVKEPVAVRYGWADNPECNLVNATGLPASPFRSDEWTR